MAKMCQQQSYIEITTAFRWHIFQCLMRDHCLPSHSTRAYEIRESGEREEILMIFYKAFNSTLHLLAPHQQPVNTITFDSRLIIFTLICASPNLLLNAINIACQNVVSDWRWLCSGMCMF